MIHFLASAHLRGFVCFRLAATVTSSSCTCLIVFYFRGYCIIYRSAYAGKLRSGTAGARHPSNHRQRRRLLLPVGDFSQAFQVKNVSAPHLSLNSATTRYEAFRLRILAFSTRLRVDYGVCA